MLFKIWLVPYRQYFSIYRCTWKESSNSETLCQTTQKWFIVGTSRYHIKLSKNALKDSDQCWRFWKHIQETVLNKPHFVLPIALIMRHGWDRQISVKMKRRMNVWLICPMNGTDCYGLSMTTLSQLSSIQTRAFDSLSNYVRGRKVSVWRLLRHSWQYIYVISTDLTSMILHWNALRIPNVTCFIGHRRWSSNQEQKVPTRRSLVWINPADGQISQMVARSCSRFLSAKRGALLFR